MHRQVTRRKFLISLHEDYRLPQCLSAGFGRRREAAMENAKLRIRSVHDIGKSHHACKWSEC